MAGGQLMLLRIVHVLDRFSQASPLHGLAPHSKWQRTHYTPANLDPQLSTPGTDRHGDWGCVWQIVAQAPNLQHFRLASSRVGLAGGIAIASALAAGEAALRKGVGLAGQGVASSSRRQRPSEGHGSHTATPPLRPSGQAQKQRMHPCLSGAAVPHGRCRQCGAAGSSGPCHKVAKCVPANDCPGGPPVRVEKLVPAAAV